MIFNQQSVKQGITPSGTISITDNGTYNVTNYASANVSVGEQYEISIQGTWGVLVDDGAGNLSIDGLGFASPGTVVSLVNPDGSSIFVLDSHDNEIPCNSIGCNGYPRSSDDVQIFIDNFGHGEEVYIAFFIMPEDNVSVWDYNPNE